MSYYRDALTAFGAAPEGPLSLDFLIGTTSQFRITVNQTLPGRTDSRGVKLCQTSMRVYDLPAGIQAELHEIARPEDDDYTYEWAYKLLTLTGEVYGQR